MQNAGYALEQLGRVSEASQLYYFAMHRFSAKPEIEEVARSYYTNTLMNMGREHYKAKRHEKALEMQRQAVKYATKNQLPAAYMGLCDTQVCCIIATIFINSVQMLSGGAASVQRGT